ncbi:hypothetical protein D9619_004773 [Psilocybe cf. subviscida]|uniref:DUF6535 domain-containing protein n=1 Tax=Psilocybe cf. subviscida TaxID=2480587 RepID=A0A8H5BQV8_9AGAR|nr:hypothetical protein D9619_004773 [Psilocybe cf. subviscida]
MPRRTIVKVYPQYDDQPFFVEHQSTPRPERPAPTRRGTTLTLNNQPDTEPWTLNTAAKYGVPKNGDPWEACYEKMRGYDDDVCDGWRSEIDNLLIFAGLFSSVVTAFLIESYTLLSQDPNDVNAWYLQQILIQIHNANTQSTAALNAPIPSPPTFSPSSRDVRINVFWFMSLSLSVAVVIIGILCTQWIREYERETSLDPQDAIALRHIRHEGLISWKVPNILRALPVMLHCSLILFFVGLVDLLWSLNHVVALFVSVISGLVFVVLVATTILPALQLYTVRDRYLLVPQCAYKSAQSWVIYRVFSFFVWLFAPSETLRKDPRFSSVRERYDEFSTDNAWDEYDMKWRKIRGKAYKEGGLQREHIRSDLVGGLVWIDKHLGQSVEAIYSVYHCLKEFKWVTQSKQALLQISEKVATSLQTPKISDYLASLSVAEQREMLSALFLEANDRAFPQLDQYRAESVVRVLNTRLGKKETGDSAVLWPFLRWPFDSIQAMPDDLITQILLCTRELVGRRMATDFGKDIWNLIRGVILTTRCEELNQVQELHKRLGFDIIRASVDNSVGLTQVGDWIERIVNTILPERNNLDLSSIKTVMVAIAERVASISPGEANPFSNPDERIRWDNFKKKYAEVIGEITASKELVSYSILPSLELGRCTLLYTRTADAEHFEEASLPNAGTKPSAVASFI